MAGTGGRCGQCGCPQWRLGGRAYYCLDSSLISSREVCCCCHSINSRHSTTMPCATNTIQSHEGTSSAARCARDLGALGAGSGVGRGARSGAGSGAGVGTGGGAGLSTGRGAGVGLAMGRRMTGVSASAGARSSRIETGFTAERVAGLGHACRPGMAVRGIGFLLLFLRLYYQLLFHARRDRRVDRYRAAWRVGK